MRWPTPAPRSYCSSAETSYRRNPRTGTRRPFGSSCAIAQTTPGSVPTASRSDRTPTTVWAGTRSSGAVCSFGCAAKTSATSSMPTASRPPGRSTMTYSPRTTTVPSASITCTAKPDPIPPKRPVDPTHTRRFRMPTGWPGMWRQSYIKGCIPRRCHSAFAIRATQMAACSATPATHSPVSATPRATPMSAACVRSLTVRTSRCGPTPRPGDW